MVMMNDFNLSKNEATDRQKEQRGKFRTFSTQEKALSNAIIGNMQVR